MQFDIYNIIFLVIAVLILFRLVRVLGRRTGKERPPSDPYSARDRNEAASNDNVVKMPTSKGVEEEVNDMGNVIDRIAKPETPLNAGLKKIAEADSTFNPEEFVKGAKSAYELIVTSFNNGDRKALKPLLSADVYSEFVNAIEDRESRSESVEFTFIGIGNAAIKTAALVRKTAHITMRFKSQVISVTKNKEGVDVDGDRNAVVDMTDIWTFSRAVTSKNPNWKLINTNSEE